MYVFNDGMNDQWMLLKTTWASVVTLELIKYQDVRKFDTTTALGGGDAISQRLK